MCQVFLAPEGAGRRTFYAMVRRLRIGESAPGAQMRILLNVWTRKEVANLQQSWQLPTIDLLLTEHQRYIENIFRFLNRAEQERYVVDKHAGDAFAFQTVIENAGVDSDSSASKT